MEIINLKGISDNYQYLKKVTDKDVIPVVKANGYGLGVVEVCKVFQEQHVKLVAVNDLNEAIELDNHNFDFDILILNSIDVNEYHRLNQNQRFIFSINSINDIINMNQYCYLNRIIIHIQIDTGMNRLGLKSLSDYQLALGMLSKNKKYVINGLYTHITHKENYFEQYNTFKIYQRIYKPNLIHHQASSTYLYESDSSAVRIGLDLYGDGSKEKITQVIKVICKPIAIKKLEKGDHVGYDGKYKATKKVLVAVLPLGYSNGFSRRLSGYTIYSNEKYFPIIGYICMNHMFVEVDEKVSLNSIFEIISVNNPLYKMAKYLKTVPGEILTRINIKNKQYLK